MDNSDDEEDTHFCLKCHMTITGLENYVEHRKSKCGRPREKSPGSEEMPDLKADDFFSSLNLQSSYKSGEAIPIKVPGILTRSKVKVTKDGGKRKRFDEEEDSEEEESEEEASSGGKWRPDECRKQLWPPPGHTGGKWKPTIDKSDLATEEIVFYERPPPSHTRGKWGPSERPWGQLRKGNLYWCGPCNRRLSSKLIYDRHIKSELHFKRTNSSVIQQPRSKRKITRTKKAVESTLGAINKRVKSDKEVKRRGGYIVCEVCRCRVWPHLMGKHLVSHYHCKHPSSKEASTALVLQNIASIVRQSPFQCALCKFYCNTQQTFLNHWASEMHRKNDNKFTGRYWCAFCKFGTESTVEMGCHLVGEAHSEVVSLINHSVPIIIQKRLPLWCEICRKRFRYNAQIRIHSRMWHHVQDSGTASDSYQEVMKCTDCVYTAFSLTSFQKHRRMKHSAKYCFCRLCNLTFETAEDAQAHRKTKEHIGKREARPKTCEYCMNVFPSIIALKKHLWNVHPEQKHKCLKCGEEFLLKQEVSQHVKSKSCKTYDFIGKQPFREHKCSECDFSCDTESELIVHAVLHKGETSNGMYPCIYCGRSFKKLSLRNHAKTHTAERPFTCTVCHLSFRRRDTLVRHVSRVHDMRLGFHGDLECETCSRRFAKQESLERHMANHSNDRYRCTECTQTFAKKSSLTQHQQRHFGKKFQCGEQGCVFKGRSEAELKIHLKTHSALRDFHCQQCDYSAKTKCQLVKLLLTETNNETILYAKKGNVLILINLLLFA
ncbi:zinc finger protein 14 isoform X2 [Cimex lectularius]|uniref:C2H2-type domain-containing protein n=1 Tax=Cimex lectularius TaxID=79782 RepID=A0A8I6SK08_CIMLE|nr:zinc finger protein 14 isoform X2 [Cimex lectularius]